MFNTLKDFGFGAKTGIDCPGETPGSLSNYRHWTRMDTSAISFGHGMAASPLQLVTAVSAIANNGVLMKPYLVAAVTDQNNQIVQSFPPHVVRRVVSESTARKISAILKTVVAEGGTGTQAALQGFSVGGKTGTAKKIGPDGTYSDDDYIASFVGFTPVDNPAITVLVIINEPRKQYYGGVVAAPAFRRIAQETLNYLNVHPDIRDGQLAAAGGTGGLLLVWNLVVAGHILRHALSTSLGIGGRGPTRLMSPISTLISCGSSSRLNLRSQRPTGVTRGSRVMKPPLRRTETHSGSYFTKERAKPSTTASVWPVTPPPFTWTVISKAERLRP